MLTSTLAVVRAAGRHVSKQGKLSHRRCVQEVFQDTPKGLAKSLQPQWEHPQAHRAQRVFHHRPRGWHIPSETNWAAPKLPWRHSLGLIPREMRGILIVLARWGPWQGSGCRQWFWSCGSSWKTPAPCHPIGAPRRSPVTVTCGFMLIKPMLEATGHAPCCIAGLHTPQAHRSKYPRGAG